MVFRDWYNKMKKENPEKLKEYRNKKQQRYRAKKKLIRKKKEAEEINQQFKAGNLNYGIKFDVPKAMSWEEFKNQHPHAKFCDYVDYKTSLKKPSIEKIDLQTQKEQNIKQEMNERLYSLIEGHDPPDKVSLSFNFFHPEEEKTDSDIAREKEQSMKNKITEWYNRKR